MASLWPPSSRLSVPAGQTPTVPLEATRRVAGPSYYVVIFMYNYFGNN